MSNALDVAKRLVAERQDGTAERDEKAWISEASVTFERLLVEAPPAAEREELLRHTASLETALRGLLTGKGKVKDLPVEPMVRLIAYARTGTIRNARIDLGE
jgi:hypothetical protein